MSTSAAVGSGLVSGPMINPIITSSQSSNTRPVSNRHGNNEPSANSVPSIERYVELRREDPTEPFGFNIKGGRDVGCPVYIWRVEQGTLAHGQGLQPGDEIISANGIDFTCINHSEALKVLKSTQLLGLLIRPSSTASVPRSGGSFRGEFYTWVDCYGTPTTPPKEVDLARSPTRLVDLQIDPGQNLGLMIRGGTEYGLGIYVTGVDPGSVAERGGLKRGDEILQVNSRSFTNITHDKAVATLKSSRKMTLTLAYLGKIPADLTYEPNSSRNPIPNLLQTIITDKTLTNGSSSATSVLQMIEEKARTVLTKSEHSRFTFYRLEYGQGFLPIYTFVRILLELLNTSEKYTLLTEVREIIRPEDRAQFDELIYKPATSTVNPDGIGNLDENGILQSSNNLDPMNSMDSELLIDPDEETNGDLVYLREFNSNTGPGGQNQIQQHGVGSDLMEHSNNGLLRVNAAGNGHDSGHIMDANGGNSLAVHHSANTGGHTNKNSNQGPGNNTGSSAIRFRVRCNKTKPLLGIGLEGGSNTSHRLPRIININPDGCAVNSNLKAGHVLLSVDGKKLDGLTHEDAVRVITDCFNSESKASLDFVVVENRNNLIVVSGQGVGIGTGSGGG